MTKRINLKVGVSGVRGIVGDYLNPQLVAGFSSSFGEYVGGGRVVIGRDTRSTGPMLEHAVVAGLLAVGCQPVLLGIVPTPTVLIAVDRFKANGGIAITASHNPVQWNALKFVSSSGIFLNHTEAAELLDIYNQPDTTYIGEQDYRNIRTMERAFDEHKRRIFASIDVAAIRQAKFRVAVDCCNGVGAYFSESFLRELGCRVFPVFNEKDGIFRRTPEPAAENLAELIATVRNNNCVCGFAQDPDGDRLALVDEHGTAIGEQYSLTLAVAHVLSRTPGNVVVNIQTSKSVADVAARFNCRVYYSPVGEINVTSEMQVRKAVVGGEGGSGGVIWPAIHPCRDSFAAMALVLEMMALNKRSLAGLMQEMPCYHTVNLKIPCSSESSVDVIRRIRKKYADEKPITVDGVRIERDDSWILVRPSNTEPIIRLTAEAASVKEANELIRQFAAENGIG